MTPKEELKQEQDGCRPASERPEGVSRSDPHSLPSLLEDGRFFCIPQFIASPAFQQQVGPRAVQLAVMAYAMYDRGHWTHPDEITDGRFCATDEQIARAWGTDSTAPVREARKRLMEAEPKVFAEVKIGRTGYPTEYRLRPTSETDRVLWQRSQSALPPRRRPTTAAAADGQPTDWLTAAVRYSDRGFSIIPVKGKHPAIPTWKPYQMRLPSTTEVTDWHKGIPGAGIAIVTGALSDLVVVDIDGPLESGLTLLEENGIDIPKTTTVRTAGGYHLWFAHPGIAVKSPSAILANEAVKIDIRGDGAYIVAPPSVHPSGVRYEFQYEADVLPAFPPALLRLLRSQRQSDGPGVDHMDLGGVSPVDPVELRVDLVKLMERCGVELIRHKVDGYKALCPFHDEKVPSLSVTPSKGLWHCFGCGAAGTAIKFVRQYFSLSSRDEAIETVRSWGLWPGADERGVNGSGASLTKVAA